MRALLVVKVESAARRMIDTCAQAVAQDLLDGEIHELRLGLVDVRDGFGNGDLHADFYFFDAVVAPVRRRERRLVDYDRGSYRGLSVSLGHRAFLRECSMEFGGRNHFR